MVNGVVTNHTYDPWGRLSTRTRGAYAASYEWRYGDKLKTVTSNFPGEAASVAYDYDGFGQRRNRSAGTDFTWWRYDLGGGTATEYNDPDTDGDIEGFSKFNVLRGIMNPLAEATVPSGQPPANATYSYLALDHLSSTRAVFSQAKAQTATMEFFPYGGRLSTSGTLPHHQFTAKPYDTGTGQYYFPYRYYSPAMARWTAADPAGTVDGPNVYGYVGSNPANNVDSLGLHQWQCDYDTSTLNRIRCAFTPHTRWDECQGCCGWDRSDCYADCDREYARQMLTCRTRWCRVRAYHDWRWCYLRCYFVGHNLRGGSL